VDASQWLLIIEVVFIKVLWNKSRFQNYIIAQMTLFMYLRLSISHSCVSNGMKLPYSSISKLTSSKRRPNPL